MEAPKLSKEQKQWVDDKLSDKNLLSLTIHGSWLYGLNTPESDIDLKAIYLPSPKQLVRGEALKTYNYKNDELNIEIEVKSISSFLKSASSCDTNCLDLLHAPLEMILYEDTELWGKIKRSRSGMYAKNIRGVVGYIKNHSKKYTNKIDRLNEMKKVLELCQNQFYDLESYHLQVKDFVSSNNWTNYKYVKVVDSVREGEQRYLEVCGKKYIFTWDIAKLRDAMITEINRYGKRSEKGVEKGIDSKSLSHALRILLQLKEIILTRDLKFPLQDATYVKSVKLGEVTDPVEVLDKIDTLFDECMQLLEDSNLPEEVDISGMEEVLEDYYFGEH